MNQPTLAERLRYIDIFLGSATEVATQQLVAEGAVTEFAPGFPNDERPNPEAQERGRLVGDRAAVLIAQQVFDEGLNPAVIAPNTRVAEAYAAISDSV